MWRGGCIIRSAFLGDIKKAYDKDPHLTNLLLDEFFSSALNKYHQGWRKAIVHAIEIGVPTPAFSTALAFYDGYRTERLPANLLQAQRDFFGAHTYERVDKPRGEFLPHQLDGTRRTRLLNDLQRIRKCKAPVRSEFASGRDFFIAYSRGVRQEDSSASLRNDKANRPGPLSTGGSKSLRGFKFGGVAHTT